MKAKNVKTNNLVPCELTRFQFCLPQLIIEDNGGYVVEFEGKHVLGLWEMYLNYMGEQNNDIQQHIRTNKDLENQKTVNRITAELKQIEIAIKACEETTDVSAATELRKRRNSLNELLNPKNPEWTITESPDF